MPVYQLRVHQVMLERLDARDSLRMIVAAAFSMGGGAEGQRYIAQLQGVMTGEAAQPKKLRPPTAADFGGMVRVKVVRAVAPSADAG